MSSKATKIHILRNKSAPSGRTTTKSEYFRSSGVTESPQRLGSQTKKLQRSDLKGPGACEKALGEALPAETKRLVEKKANALKNMEIL